MSDAANQPPSSNTSRTRNSGWIIYFALLLLASVGVTVGMILFNLMIQLTPEQLSAARTLWQEKGPRDYKLIYTKRINDDRPITLAVTVKDGKVIQARKDGQATESENDYAMDGIFADVERLMQEDRKPGVNKVYTIARFDDRTGALLHFVHNGAERIEINVKPDWLGP